MRFDRKQGGDDLTGDFAEFEMVGQVVRQSLRAAVVAIGTISTYKSLDHLPEKNPWEKPFETWTEWRLSKVTVPVLLGKCSSAVRSGSRLKMVLGVEKIV